MQRFVLPRALRASVPRPCPHPGAQAAYRRVFHGSGWRNSEIVGAAAKQVPGEAEQTQPGATASSPRRQQRITVADILERRRKAGKLVALTAAASDSDMFKVSPPGDKPLARRWDHMLSPESASREPCKLKQAARHLKKPGLISLGGGIPCPDNFPIESISMRIPTVAGGFSEAETRAAGQDVCVGKYDVRDTAADPEGGAVYDLSIALNYGQATGSAQMLRFVTEHTELVCAPPYADWRSCLTVGSTGALDQALRIFCDGRGRSDSVLTEEFSFSTAVETALPLGVGVFGVPIDAEGLLPDAMDEMLRGWDPARRGGRRKPHVLYTVPSGQNPTGATQGEARRRAIYDVCRRHDVFILEDEPYYFLQMPAYQRGRETATAAATEATPESTEQFLDGLIPTLLSMDVDGRVLRMDSFSKVVVPGSRLGWVTGSEQVIERYIRHGETCNQGPSGISQVLLHKLLDESWGHEGYLRWLMRLRGEYTRRRDVMMAACEDFLPREVVSWTPPRAGMFHWLKVDHTRHPDVASRSILDLEEDIFGRCIDSGVLVAPGSWFMAEQGSEPTGLYFRATFAAATPENMTEAIRRFGEAVRQSFKLS
ncbi:hypothetical protein RB595_007324 [Gaeumannomyces hyphopodioides]